MISLARAEKPRVRAISAQGSVTKRSDLAAFIDRIWYPEAGEGTLARGLSPLAALYGLAWRIRQGLATPGVRLPARVISVGNLTAGGTGKTPVVAAVARVFMAAGLQPAVLSRGYGRSARERLVIASDRTRILADAAAAGDEPLMLARMLPGVPVVVSADRARAGRKATEDHGAGALVLDDGFQNQQIEKDLEIVTVDGRRLFGNGRMLPAGPLRMPKTELRRADVVIITKLGPQDDPGPVRETLRVLAPDAKVFEGRTVAVEFRDLLSGKSVPVDYMRRRRVASMCALADPLPFTRLLEEEGIEVAGRFAFPDHHVYGPEEVSRVREQAHAIEAVVTTEKDSVKLEEAWLRGDPPVLSLITKVEMDQPEEFARIVLGNGSVKSGGGAHDQD